ncbi:MAG: glycosyltransferase family 2 protein [Verrucomicrobium sp.]|nr:glycosyltransferase family 2 protein [Verrucomicrobium sp.]
MPEPKVNIGVVTYNRLDFTRQCLEALRVVTRHPFVLTVVDNASSDGTPEYLLSLKEQGLVDELLLLPENVGVARAANLAWQAVPDAAFYVKLDNDIVLQKPEWLGDLVAASLAFPAVPMWGYNFEADTGIFPVTREQGHAYRTLPEGRLHLGGACVLVPAGAAETFGMWCEDYGLYGEEDTDFGWRIRCAGLQSYYLEDEFVGLHLPAGRGPRIDPVTNAATDGMEEVHAAGYRAAKDASRQRNLGMGGLFSRNRFGYENRFIPLYTPSRVRAVPAPGPGRRAVRELDAAARRALFTERLASYEERGRDHWNMHHLLEWAALLRVLDRRGEAVAFLLELMREAGETLLLQRCLALHYIELGEAMPAIALAKTLLRLDPLDMVARMVVEAFRESREPGPQDYYEILKRTAVILATPPPASAG